jgi:predicted RNA-binding Zn ribbon-like protein
MDGELALELAGTIRHDGRGGVADDLATEEGLAAWLADRPGLPAAGPGALARVVAVREAVRALFARAVRPGPPSPADAQRLLPAGEAVARLNAAAAGVPVVPRLDWPEAGAPTVHPVPAAPADPVSELTATLARAAIAFLTGPDRERLRACTAPRCVRYFLRSHGRQEFCKTSCGNRARAARHYRLRRDAG